VTRENASYRCCALRRCSTWWWRCGDINGAPVPGAARGRDGIAAARCQPAGGDCCGTDLCLCLPRHARWYGLVAAVRLAFASAQWANCARGGAVSPPAGAATGFRLWRRRLASCSPCWGCTPGRCGRYLLLRQPNAVLSASFCTRTGAVSSISSKTRTPLPTRPCDIALPLSCYAYLYAAEGFGCFGRCVTRGLNGGGHACCMAWHPAGWRGAAHNLARGTHYLVVRASPAMPYLLRKRSRLTW